MFASRILKNVEHIRTAINHCLSLIWFPPEMCIRISFSLCVCRTYNINKYFVVVLLFLVPMMLKQIHSATYILHHKNVFLLYPNCQIFELAFFSSWQKCFSFFYFCKNPFFYRLQFITQQPLTTQRNRDRQSEIN